MDTGGSITDVPGLLIGHHQRRGRGWRTGTTVVLAPDGAVAGVDVRGGGPGTRETDALAPGTLVERINAVCLSGGSAYGLAAADGVMTYLADLGLGVRVGEGAGEVVPVVPTAVIFDLGRGGRFESRPDATFGRRAAAAATRHGPARGAIGAGTGATAGGLQGGIGSASVRLGDVVVAATVVVNSAGSVIDPDTGLPWDPHGLRLRRPTAGERRAVRVAIEPEPTPLNTTIGIVATSADLDVAEATKLADVGHDGIARAVRPAHSLFDGDTLFGLATGTTSLTAGSADTIFGDASSRAARLNDVFEAGARCVAAACIDAVLSATSHTGAPAGPPTYRELVPQTTATGSRS